mmetsp:Transcript_904/g.1169  ORF Transcript_904/g.1169 Transcript_904/m.1169 type:complete len:125 (+) Transcript_904:357-731(+)
MKNKGAFQGFEEGPITFLPTYKYDIDADVYDTSKKRRVPSYTDRILFKSRLNKTENINNQDQNQNQVELIEYNTIQEIRISDHRPVYANFLVPCPLTGVMDSGGPTGLKITETGMSSSQVCAIS